MKIITHDGQQHYLVPRWWVIITMTLITIGFVILLVITAVAIDNKRAIEEAYAITSKSILRARATKELSRHRVEVAQWNYTQTCLRVKREGAECLPNPQFWLNPIDYPDLANDPQGEGLFEPK